MRTEDLRQANKDRCEDHFHAVDAWPEERWALAAAGEMGEMCNALKKVLRGDGQVDAVYKEIGDTVIYLDLLCQRMRIPLEFCIAEAFNSKSDEIGSAIKLKL